MILQVAGRKLVSAGLVLVQQQRLPLVPRAPGTRRPGAVGVVRFVGGHHEQNRRCVTQAATGRSSAGPLLRLLAQPPLANPDDWPAPSPWRDRRLPRLAEYAR